MHMRVALVSPYSWTHPGGVTRHIEALSAELLAAGHDVRVLAPYDGDPRERADELISLGRTVGLPFNGAVSNLALTPLLGRDAAARAARGRFDVVHVHEPVAPVPGWLALAVADAPLVGTFHTYTERVRRTASPRCWGSRRNLNRLRVRIAVSEAAGLDGAALLSAASTGSSPTASCCPAAASAPAPPRAGRAAADRVRRPGRRAQGPAGAAARLRGAARARARAPDRDRRRAEASSRRCSTTARRDGARARRTTPRSARRSSARTCSARPSLGGESFGMVLTEAFAAGTPVVASDIAGYRDVVDARRRRAARAAAATRSRSARRCATSRSTAARERSRCAPGARARALRLAAVAGEVVSATRTRARARARGRDARARPCASARAPPTAAARRPRGGCRRSSRADAPAARGRLAAAPRRCAGAPPPRAARCSRVAAHRVDAVGARSCRSSPPGCCGARR
jgi:phosphatidylinositol alpha-mannosyltransferase